MPFNGPINGDYSNCDWTKAPWIDELMTLTHEECLFVLDRIDKVIEEYKPEDNAGNPLSETAIYSDYNSGDWEHAISWSTFNLIRTYDPEVNTLGINENGIITTESPTE